MATYYLDSSALVKRYARERGSSWVDALTTSMSDNDSYTVRLTIVEVVSALTRKARTDGATPAAAKQGILLFRQEWSRDYLILEVTPAVVERATLLVEIHGLRGYDAVHLGAALETQKTRRQMGLPALIFVSADNNQRKAAAAEGLPVEDPNAHP